MIALILAQELFERVLSIFLRESSCYFVDRFSNCQQKQTIREITLTNTNKRKAARHAT